MAQQLISFDITVDLAILMTILTAEGGREIDEVCECVCVCVCLSETSLTSSLNLLEIAFRVPALFCRESEPLHHLPPFRTNAMLAGNGGFAAKRK